MTISEFCTAFSNREIQIHVDTIAEFNECLDMLIDLGYSVDFDREYWGRKGAFAVVSNGSSVGLNYKHDSSVKVWGEIIRYHDLVFTPSNERLQPASHGELLALLGMGG